MADLTERILWIVDRPPYRLPKAARGKHWDILGLGCTKEELERSLMSGKGARTDIRVLNLQRWKKNAERRVREFVVPLLDNLTKRKLKNCASLGAILQQPDGPNLWWFMAISEKSPFRSPLIHELYYLALIRSASKAKKYTALNWMTKNKLLADVASGDRPTYFKQPLLRLLRWPHCCRESLYWIRAGRAVLLVVCIKTLALILGWKDHLAQGASTIFTIFPSWWNNSESESAFERFFPEKPKSLFRKPPVYWAWWSAGLIKTWNVRKKWGFILKKNKISILQRHVPLKELYRAFLPKPFFRLVKFRKGIGQHNWPLYLGFQIKRLLEREISRSIAAGDSIDSQLIFAANRKLACLTSPAELIFRFEGQPLDRALISATRGICPSVGFWHSPFAMGPNYLPLLFKKSIQPQTHRSAPMPLPDEMIAPHGFCQKSLIRNGYLKHQIRICGSLRSKNVLRIVRRLNWSVGKMKRPALKKEHLKIFLACSADPKENVAILYAFHKALETLPNLRLTFRPHPACGPPQGLLDLIKRHPKIHRFRLAADLSFHEELRRSDVVVTGGSTLALEAIAFGLMPIVFESPASFSACSMRSFAKSLIIVQDAKEITKSILYIYNKKRVWKSKTKTWPVLCKNLSMPIKS